MGNRRDRDENEKERLEAQVRELKSTNKQLMRRLKRLSKGYKKFLDEEPLEELPPEPEKKICYDCERGEMVLVEVLNRRWRQCNICDRRSKIKIL